MFLQQATRSRRVSPKDEMASLERTFRFGAVDSPRPLSGLSLCSQTSSASAHCGENALCDRHYTKEGDALAQDWRGEVCFCSPPYDDIE